jgi:alpha-D-ribose 1-methylphosphonate 5-triphosphate synthase subunit PhnH
MARPGQVHRASGVQPPAPLCVAAGAVLLTLVDHETPLWLDSNAEASRAWITFHCGAPSAAPSDAAFALGLAMPDLRTLPTGSHETPETSATLILQVASLSAGRRYRLSGPGLRTSATLSVDGLPTNFVEAWQRNHALFPCGVDLILCAGDQLAALPRTVTVQEA